MSDHVLIEVRTVCSATVEEKWILRVPPEIRDAVAADNNAALDLLSEYFVSVENVDVRDEEDRDIVRVTDVE